MKETNLEKTIEVSEKELNINQDTDLKDMINNLNYYNEKIGFLLGEWIVDYGFNNKPDPYKAIAWATNQDKGMHATQSAKWFWEYNRIFELVEMIHDYNISMREVLKGDKNNG